MKGFTLIELLVVVLIIGILAAVALPQYQKAVWKARFSEVDATINALDKQVELFRLDGGFSGNFATPEDMDINVFENMTPQTGSWTGWYCSKYACYRIERTSALSFGWVGRIYEKENKQNLLVLMYYGADIDNPSRIIHGCGYDPAVSGNDLGKIFCEGKRKQGWEDVGEELE